ncbi:retrovirus-related pol polyprotein from transposon TNT 1-94 [Tanacetum coccineum]
MTTLAEFMITAGADNRPPMLEKSLYDSWKSRMELYIENRENGRMILNSLQNGPLVWPTVEEDGTTRTKKYEELSVTEKLQADCDLKATNIVLQGLPPDVYAIMNHHKVAKDIWDRVKLLMQGTKLSLQEKECKLYDKFDKQVQVNTKFLNSLPPEWGKFVKDVKLARDLHTTNYDQLYSYLEQHEAHANETRLMLERYQYPLAFFSLTNTYYDSTSLLSSTIFTNVSTTSSITTTNQSFIRSTITTISILSNLTCLINCLQLTSPSTQPLTEFPQMDSSLAVPVFNQGDDQIACLNKAMAFLTTVASSRVTVQQVQGRQGQSYTGNSYKGNATSSGGNNARGLVKVVKCYNCQGEGHMARQCTQTKRPRNAAWFKEKAMLAKAQEAEQILDEEQLAFLADPSIPNGQTAQTTIPNTAAFQTEDLDAYDSNYDDVSNAKAVLMANLSNYGSDVISKVPYFEPYHTNMDNQNVHAMQEQMIDHVNNWETTNQEKKNESLTAELERYKERVKTFEQRLNIDLSTHEKMIDSKMDDMIKEKLALKQQINSLKQNLSNQIKEKEFLLQTFTVLKNESKEKENKYIDKEIDLEKKIKELDNIVYKATMLVASPVFDDEDTLILEELNRLTEYFCKRFVPQQELSDEQVFWLQTSHPNTDQSALSPVKIEAPRKLPKVSLFNTSLKKLKYHLGQFDTVVKKRITPDAITEGEWDLLNEVTKVQTVFNQMEAAVQQYFVDKQCFEIQKKELFLENDLLLQKIMSQDVMICVMNSNTVFDDVNVEMQSSESCVKCVDLDAELLNEQNAYNDLSKSYSQLEKYCISLELTIQLNQEIFQNDSLTSNQNALEIPEYFDNNVLKAQLQAKDTTICMFKIDLEPLAPRLLNNKEAHIDYLNYTQEQADILQGIVEQAKAKQPLDNALDFAFETPKPEIKVYSRRSKQIKSVGSSKKAKIVESKNANNSEPNHLWGSNATYVPSSSSLVNDRLSRLSFGTVRFKNDQIAKNMGYGDYQLGNVIISRVYYVKGLGHNLFSVGLFCDADLEVASRKNTCFIRNLDGVDLLSGYRDTNLYTISLDDMLKTSPIYLLSRSSKTKSWLWHRQLSHLNFGTLNKLAKDGLARGIPKLKFQKDHLCSTCALGKSKTSSHQPKVEDTNQEKLYLLNMDLSGSMHVESINRKKYILMIVDDYSRFTWVRFLRSKDEAPDAIIK